MRKGDTMPFPNPDTQIKPGQVLNPKGRPMRPSAKVLQKLLDETPFEKMPARLQKKIREKWGDMAIREAMSWAMLEMVVDQGKSTVAAFKEVRETHEGKLDQALDLTVPNMPDMSDGELSRRVVSIVLGLIKSRQETGTTPPQPSTQGEPTNETQTSGGVGPSGSPADGPCG